MPAMPKQSRLGPLKDCCQSAGGTGKIKKQEKQIGMIYIDD
jgi:hypothetical protein